jgi:hypothetical protein
MKGEVSVDLGWLIEAVVKTGFSLLCGGISYFIWMAAFLLASRLGNPVVEALLWLLAPVETALGFAVGVAIVERRTRTGTGSFLRTFVWPLVACALGAVAVYWFGPMLIVFSMLAAGTASVLLREVLLKIR